MTRVLPPRATKVIQVVIQPDTNRIDGKIFILLDSGIVKWKYSSDLDRASTSNNHDDWNEVALPEECYGGLNDG